MSTPLRVLIAEDSENDTGLVVRELRRGGYDVTYERVDTAPAMLAALDRQQWDLVISDHAMPQFSAPAALALLQAKCPDLPMIVVSGEIDLNLAVELMKVGVQDYVQKDQLARLIPAIVRNMREMEARRERQKAEEALRESEEKHRHLFESSPESLVLVGLDGIILDCNAATTTISGLTRAETIGKPFTQLSTLNNQDLPQYMQLFMRAVSGETMEPLQIQIVHSNGEPRWLEVSPVLLKREGKVYAIQVITRDITERKQTEVALRESEQRFRQLAEENAGLLEQARQNAATPATLLDEVNHRVKNNLASIMGILALESQRSIRGEVDYRIALREIQNRIQGMAAVHEMLSATRWSPLPLVDLVTRVVHEALSNSPIRQNILVTVTPPTDLVLIAPRQATALALIINELTTNSLKHAFQERGRGRIEVRITAEGEDGRLVRLEFRNDGPDWPDDVLHGQRENVGLHLVRTTVRSPLRGKLVLHNDNGAATLITFELVSMVQEPVQKGP